MVGTLIHYKLLATSYFSFECLAAMTESFGSQIGISRGIGLWFTSPQGRKFSDEILGVWPVEKENSCGAAFSPEENQEYKCFHKKSCPVWSHSSIDRLGARILNLHKSAHGI